MSFDVHLAVHRLDQSQNPRHRVGVAELLRGTDVLMNEWRNLARAAFAFRRKLASRKRIRDAAASPAATVAGNVFPADASVLECSALERCMAAKVQTTRNVQFAEALRTALQDMQDEAGSSKSAPSRAYWTQSASRGEPICLAAALWPCGLRATAQVFTPILVAVEKDAAANRASMAKETAKGNADGGHRGAAPTTAQEEPSGQDPIPDRPAAGSTPERAAWACLTPGAVTTPGAGPDPIQSHLTQVEWRYNIGGVTVRKVIAKGDYSTVDRHDKAFPTDLFSSDGVADWLRTRGDPDHSTDETYSDEESSVDDSHGDDDCPKSSRSLDHHDLPLEEHYARYMEYFVEYFETGGAPIAG